MTRGFRYGIGLSLIVGFFLIPAGPLQAATGYEVSGVTFSQTITAAQSVRVTEDLTVSWTAPTNTALISNYYLNFSTSSAPLSDTAFNDTTYDFTVAHPMSLMTISKNFFDAYDSNQLRYLHIKTQYLNTNTGSIAYSDDVVVGPIRIDNVAPTGTIRIVDASGNNDINSTSDTMVYLKLAVSKDPIKVYLSETSARPAIGAAFSADAVYSLGDATPGEKTIYAWFEDSVGNISAAPATDGFTLLSATNISPNTANIDLASGGTQIFRVEGTSASYDWSIINPAPESSGTVAQFSGSSSVNSVTVQGLVKGTFQLQAVPMAGGITLTSGTISVVQTVDTTPPAAVTGLGATPLATGDLKLDWTNPTADFSGVIVLAKTGAAPALAPVNGTTYTVGQDGVLYVGNLATYTETLAHGIHRYYNVFAYDAAKNYSAAASADATSSDTMAPAAPTGPTASAGNAQVTLTWTNPMDADFAGIVILMKQVSAPTGVPVAGTSYSAGNTVGDATVAYAAYANRANTATITGLTNSIRYYFAIYAVDEWPNFSTAARVNAIPGPPEISAPTLPKDVHVGEQLSFTATSGTGSYAWTATAGTLSAATGASVTWTAPAPVAVSPTSVTVRVTDPTTALFVQGIVNVYSSVVISDKPATPPVILSGGSKTFNAGGGDSSFTWTVKDRAGNIVGTPQTGAAFTFTAPTTGAFAGEYTIEVADSRGGKDSFKVQVPFTLTPSGKTILKTATEVFVVNGAGTSYTWDILESSTSATPVTTFGTWSKTNPVADDNTNTFTPDVAIKEVKTFYIRITVNDDADLTDANGLNQKVFGPFRILPAAEYTVNVKKADGAALSGAVVTVDDPNLALPVTTGADGKAKFNLADTGGKYNYYIVLTGYVSQTVSSTEKTVNATLQTVAATITGTVKDSAGVAIKDATVTAYIPATLATQFMAVSGAFGAYTIALPTGAATTGWTVVAANTWYTSGKQTGVAIAGGTAVVNFVLTAKGMGAPDVDAGGGSKNLSAGGQGVMVDVPVGGVTTNGYIVITQAAKTSTTSTFTAASPSYVYDIKVTSDPAGITPLSAADIKRIVITLPIDLGVLKPGDLESGRYVIYMAATKAALESGSVATVPLANIIATDYMGSGMLGSVTFWVDHLGFFGVGIAAGVSPLAIVPMGNGDLGLNWINPNQPEFSGVLVVAATGVTPPFTPVDGVSYTVGQNGIVAAGSINTFVDTPLENGVHRYYKIFAYDNMLHYSFPALLNGISSDTNGPSAPTGFQATPGDKEVTLRWTNPTDGDFGGILVLVRQGAAPGGVPVAGTSYNVSDTIGDAIVAYKGNSDTAVINGLTNGTRYYFSIYAFDERPNYSLMPAVIDVTPIPVSIAGQVINAEGFIPIPGATVTITKGSDVFTKTAQADGRFSFSNVPSGAYNIEFASSDYWSLKGSITVNVGATTLWNVIAIPNTMIAQIRSGYVTQEQLNQAVAANAAKDAIIVQRDQAIASMFTKEQLDQAVAAERMKWDINGDGKMGLEVVISILQKMIGLR